MASREMEKSGCESIVQWTMGCELSVSSVEIATKSKKKRLRLDKLS